MIKFSIGLTLRRLKSQKVLENLMVKALVMLSMLVIAIKVETIQNMCFVTGPSFITL